MSRAATLFLLLSACTHSTELLGPGPPQDEVEAGVPDAIPPTRPFCPTTLDVYGGANVQLVGCGGPQLAPDPLADGYFAPGTASYDASLAGRIYARLVGDPDLVPRFGSVWTVRSCSAPEESISTLAAALPVDDCGHDSPDLAGTQTDACSSSPASLLLISAGMLDDRCHGGGPDSDVPDDPETYAHHFAMRLDSFLISRHPTFALIGPTTEWTAVPTHNGPPLAFGGCNWSRPDWDTLGLKQWQQGHTATVETLVVPDLHDDFKSHNRCCKALELTCGTAYSSIPAVVNCDGASAIVDQWYRNLKNVLLANNYECPTF
jgi:hypothetical protein